jgi:hypothetical protein
MTFNFLFDVTCLVIYGLVFGVQQVVEGFWFLWLLFCGVGVVCCLCECYHLKKKNNLRYSG